MHTYIELGIITSTHGLKGDVKVTPWCDDISVFEKIDGVYIDNKQYEILSARLHKNSYIIKFKGLDNIDQAELMKNKIISADKNDIPELDENTYYVKDLLGMTVLENDKKIGVISDWFPTGSNDVYVVKTETGKEILLPAIKQVVKNIDIDNKIMTVEIMEGLIEDED